MNNGINWNSTSRKFTMGAKSYVLVRNRGTSRMIGSPAPSVDKGSLWVALTTSVFAFVMFTAINGFLAILWLMVLAPLSLSVAGMIAGMGGVGCQRMVATVYVIGLASLIVYAAGGF